MKGSVGVLFSHFIQRIEMLSENKIIKGLQAYFLKLYELYETVHMI